MLGGNIFAGQFLRCHYENGLKRGDSVFMWKPLLKNQKYEPKISAPVFG